MKIEYVKKDLFDIKIYIETDLDVRRKRFLTRACGERNQDMENALKHWEYIKLAISVLI